MITFNNIVERFKIFAENHFFIETFSFGSPDDVDLTKFTSFPLMHLVYTGATYDPGTKTYNLEIYILDVPADKTAKVDRQKEVVSDAEQCAEDIIADIKNGGNIFLFAQDYEVVNATTTPLEEETKNVLSGVLLDLSVSIPYEWDACNAPIDGVEPGGTEVTYARRGVLRMLTLDGATDVPSVRTIKVTNGTLTDDGDGVVTLDTGGVDTLAGLTDVDVTGVTDGQVLKYDDATGEWIPANDQSATSLGNLDDVSLATPSNREALIYDGDNWVNDNVTKSDVGLGNVDNTSDADKPVSTATQTALDLKANTADVPTELNDLSDVSLTTPTGNQALIYNATASAFQALPSYTNRFEDEAEQAASDAVTGTGLFIERYYSAKADGDGIFIDAQSDTPATGKKIVRKIYQIQGGLNDTTVTGWTLLTTFADDTAYSATVSTFDGYRDGDTYGTPPFTLAQTWEEQTAAPSFTGLLNESYGSGAAAAYGTRRLNGNYTGACMTIRRASDGTTTTIGFVGEEIDESAIETFCTGTTCTLQVWHDQSQSGGTGSGNDATQTTPANQPTIYTGGQLVKEGGRLMLGAASGTAIMNLGTTLTDSNLDIFSVNKSNGTGAFLSSDPNDLLWISQNGNTDPHTVRMGTPSYYFDGTQFTGTTRTDLYNEINGVQHLMVALDVDVSDAVKTEFGWSDVAGYPMFQTQEIIFFNTDKSTDRTSIEGNISAYYQSAKLLDEQFGENAAAAYSVRQLKRANTECMVIRRASDGTTTTIGFDGSGNIDESAINTFCSGTTCTLQTWKDQSGNGNDATQATAANQPTIYTGGAIVKENGMPAVEFDGSDDGLTLSSLTYGNGLSLISLYNQTSGTRGRIWCDDITGQQGYWILFGEESSGDSQKVYINDGAGFDNWTHQTAPINQQNLLNIFFSSSQIVDSVNGTAQTQSVTGFSPPINLSGSSAGFAIGNSGNLTHATAMRGQEFILYNSDKSTDRTSIESNIGDYFTQNTPLLDTYSGAAAAYSLRKLSSSYSGSAIRVRRASDNAESDIGFNVFGELSTVELAAFCGSSDGFVKTWYSQVGTGVDATQTNTAFQPKIYDSSTGVVTENGKPALEFDNSNDSFVDVTGLTYNTNDVGAFVVCRATSGHQSYATALNLGPASNSEIAIAYRTERFIYCGTEQGTGNSDQAQNLVSIYADNASNDVKGYIDQVQKLSTTTVSNSKTSFEIANLRGLNSTYWGGTIQEIVFYASSSKADHTNIEDNINTFYSIY